MFGAVHLFERFALKTNITENIQAMFTCNEMFVIGPVPFPVSLRCFGCVLGDELAKWFVYGTAVKITTRCAHVALLLRLRYLCVSVCLRRLLKMNVPHTQNHHCRVLLDNACERTAWIFSHKLNYCTNRLRGAQKTRAVKI